MSQGGNTLEPIELDRAKYATLTGSALIDEIAADLKALRDKRFDYYNELRASSSANQMRSWMSKVAAAAVLLTVVATIMRITDVAKFTIGQFSIDKADVWVFVVALVLYGILGAVSLYEKTSDVSSSYFRHVAILHGIRDLWTKLEFSLLQETVKANDLDPTDTAGAAAVRDRVIALAQAFCNDLAKLVSDEQKEWRTEFMASISELETVAKEGMAKAQADLEKSAKAHKEATEKAEKEAKEAQAAAKAAEEAAKAAAEAAAEAAKSASKPTLLNVTVSGTDYDKITITIDDVERITTDKKVFAIDQLTPGPAKVEAEAVKDTKKVSKSQWIDLKPGIQALALAFG